MDTVSLWHEERGDGFPFVLVHGFTGSHRDWEGVVDELAQGRRVVTLDHRGHGESPNTGEPVDYTFDHLVADLEGLLADLGIDTARSEGMATLYERIEGFLPEDQRERVRWANEHMDVAAFVELAQELSAYPSMLEDLASLTVPTTVIVGEGDTGLRGAADDLVATIPGAVFELIPDAAHSPQLENRDAWMRAVQGHLRRAEAP
jgi:pimeloyl-ACP methyl ester carboxylesterase